MKIIFFGSDPWFSPPVLAALLKAGIEVPLVVTKGDAIREALIANREPQKKSPNIIQANTQEDISRLTVNDSRFTKDNRPGAIVLASFGPPFLAAEVLQWPKYGCFNVHASLLPRWRGASPVFAALAAGDKETGVSIMRMTEEIDRGPILGWKNLIISQPRQSKGSDLGSGERSDPFDSRETLTKRLGLLGGELIVETLKKLETGQISEVKQPEKSPTPYTRRLTKDSGRIDWSRSPIEIERFIRAAFPWPSAMSNVKFKMKNSKWQTIQNIKILKAHLERVRDFREFSRFSRKTNRVKNDLMLTIDQIQLPGKTPVSWKQFLAGHPEAKLC